MNKTKTVLYCIGGLGTDRMVFDGLNIPGVELEILDWLPHSNGERLERYAERMAEEAAFPEEFNLLGVSFGGMLATEIAKALKPKNLFLLSSIQTASEVPRFYRTVGNLKTHHLMPARLLKSSNLLSRFFFGVNAKKDHHVFRDILDKTDPAFLRWALDAILRWENREKIAAVKIHGTHDRILGFHEASYSIENAGHFMIHTHAEEISTIIKKELFDL